MRATTAGGVPAGAIRMIQAVASKPGMNSETDGTCGNCGERLSEVTASGTIAPDLICPTSEGRPSTPACTSPAITACMAGEPPR